VTGPTGRVPLRVGLRVGSLADLFDAHEPGPLAGRRIIEASVAAYLSDRLAELPGDGDPVITLALDPGAEPSATDVAAATEAFRAAWDQALERLERERSRDQRYGLRYLLAGMTLLIIGFLLGQAGLLGVTGDGLYLLGTVTAVTGGVLVISSWVLVWEATSIAVFGHRDHNRQAAIARRLGRAMLVVEAAPA